MQPFLKTLLVTGLIATAGFASYAQNTTPSAPQNPAGQTELREQG